MANQLPSKWFLFFLLAVLSTSRLAAGELPPNVESIQVAEPLAAASPAVAAAPVAAAATPAVPVAAAPVVSAAPIETVAAPVDGLHGITGTTTEHKNADGSIVTVTKFNGQLPANALHQHFPPMFSSIGTFGNPFYGFGSPLYPTYQGQFRSARAVSDEDNKDSSPSTDGKKSQMEKRVRVSEKFHYPSPPPEYFSVHKRPFVPVIDNEFSDLI